jgi:NADH-quinone oxidoreductase subunit M
MLLSILIFLPLLLAGVLLFLPDTLQRFFKWINLGTSLVQLVLGTWIWHIFDKKSTDYQLFENYNWIDLSLGSLGRVSIHYTLGIDGFSLPMVWLAALVMLIGAMASFEIGVKHKAYFTLYLLLNASVMGCFLAVDFFLFFLFFEFMLLPMYFLIGLWGGPRREYASLKFFIYTLVGSIFILVVMIALYLSVANPLAIALEMGYADALGNISTEMLTKVQQDLAQNQIPSEIPVRSSQFFAKFTIKQCTNWFLIWYACKITSFCTTIYRFCY